MLAEATNGREASFVHPIQSTSTNKSFLKSMYAKMSIPLLFFAIAVSITSTVKAFSPHIACLSSHCNYLDRNCIARGFRLNSASNNFLSSDTNNDETNEDELASSLVSFSDDVEKGFEYAEAGNDNEKISLLASSSSIPLRGDKDYQKVLNSQLKRNLVQETIRAYKTELLAELSRGRPSSSTENEPNGYDYDASVKDKLTSLIQVNPVSTTTDSNLLEGEWELAFIAPSAAEVLNATPARLNVRNKRGDNVNKAKIPPPKRRDQVYSALSSFVSSSTRNIVLENLKEDEDPYLIEALRVIGGFVQYRRKYLVNGLTRTSLDISWASGSRQLRLGPISLKLGMTKASSKKAMLNILYLDSDLCISMTGVDQTGPLFVYTKSENWINVDNRAKRRIQSAMNLAGMIQSPLRLRQRIRFISNTMKRRKDDQVIDKIVIQKETRTSKLKVLKLGEASGYQIDDNNESWDGEEDPFVHLDATTRQEVMKKMSIKEINEAGKRQKYGRKSGPTLAKNRAKQFKPPKSK